MFTDYGRAWRQGIRPRHPHVQCQLQELDEAFGIGMEEAKISDTPEAARQDMLEQQPEEFPARQCADLSFALVVLIAETDCPVSTT